MRVIKAKSNALLTIVATIVLALMMIALVFTSLQQGQVISVLSENLDVTRDQVKDSGEKPLSPPSAEITDSGGVSIKGDKGEKGDAGEDGHTPVMSELINIFSLYCSSTSCTGPGGADSKVPGPIGPAGLNSTVPGPTGNNGADGASGENGTNGVDGAPGADGMPGANGVDGAAGTNGEPPFSWSVTRNLANGSIESESCVRKVPFISETPEYTCETTVTPKE